MNATLERGRVDSIDAMRGVAILLMIVGNFAQEVRWVPTAFKHAPDVGFTIADLIAPVFILTIGLTVGPSMARRRVEAGARRALVHMARRGLALIGIGAVITVGQAILKPQEGVDITWGVLQCIGASTLLLLPFVYLPTWARLVTGAAALTGFQTLLDQFWLADVVRASHNGIWGSLSWGGMLMLSTVVGDLFHDARTQVRQLAVLASTGAAAVALGLALAPWQPISKHRASATYMLLSLGLCLLLFALMHLAYASRPHALPWLLAIGRNPLVLYLMNLPLLGLFTLPSVEWWHVGAPLWLTLTQEAGLVILNLVVARELDRRGLVVRL